MLSSPGTGFENSLTALFETAPLSGIQLYTGSEIEGKSDAVDAFLAHWRSNLNDGNLPTRADIRPRELGRHLPHAVLLDVVEEAGELAPFRLIVRLIGSHVSEAYGEITGQDISEMGNRAAARRIYRMSALAMERLAPVMSYVRGFATGREHMEAYALYLPLRAKGGGAAKILVAVDVRLAEED